MIRNGLLWFYRLPALGLHKTIHTQVTWWSHLCTFNRGFGDSAASGGNVIGRRSLLATKGALDDGKPNRAARHILARKGFLVDVFLIHS